MAAYGSDSFKRRQAAAVNVHATNHVHTRSSSNVSADLEPKQRLTSHNSRKFSNTPDGKLASRRSFVTADMVKEVRNGLTDTELGESDERMINQFLRATKMDVQQAVKRLKATIAWRLKEQPHRRICTMCAKTSGSHYLQVVGFTKLDQPIIYSCFAMAKDRTLAANREHMLTTFEQAIRLMPPHVEQWIWIADYHGFGLKDCDPRLAKIFLEVSERHYPERLACFYNISTPSIFPMFFKAFESYIDPYTRSKIKFLSFNAKKDSKQRQELSEELGKVVEPSMLDWLLKEMEQNRTRGTVKHKGYPYGVRFLEGASLGKAVYEGHDCRGHSELIGHVEADPKILVPPGA